MPLIAEITYTKAFTKWVPNDSRVDAVECNIYCRRAFGKLPENATSFKLRIWNEKPETQFPLHEMVSTKHQSGRCGNAFLSKFRDKRNTLTHHHMSHGWMKIIDPENDLLGGSAFWFELEPIVPTEDTKLTQGGFPV